MTWEQLIDPENRWMLICGLGVLAGLVTTIVGLFIIRRFRRGKAQWQEARSSTRGMHLGMQGNADSQDFSGGA